MEQKIYQCDAELETVILKQGLIETTDERDKRKGKKEFRKGKSCSTCVRLDYVNLVIYEHGLGVDSLESTQIPEEDLRLFFWYFHSKSVDKKFISGGHFNLDRVRDCAERLVSQLQYYRKLNSKKPEQRKLERLLKNLNAVKLT